MTLYFTCKMYTKPIYGHQYINLGHSRPVSWPRKSNFLIRQSEQVEEVEEEEEGEEGNKMIRRIWKSQLNLLDCDKQAQLGMNEIF